MPMQIVCHFQNCAMPSHTRNTLTNLMRAMAGGGFGPAGPDAVPHCASEKAEGKANWNSDIQSSA